MSPVLCVLHRLSWVLRSLSRILVCSRAKCALPMKTWCSKDTYVRCCFYRSSKIQVQMKILTAQWMLIYAVVDVGLILMERLFIFSLGFDRN